MIIQVSRPDGTKVIELVEAPNVRDARNIALANVFGDDGNLISSHSLSETAPSARAAGYTVKQK